MFLRLATLSLLILPSLAAAQIIFEPPPPTQPDDDTPPRVAALIRVLRAPGCNVFIQTGASAEAVNVYSSNGRLAPPPRPGLEQGIDPRTGQPLYFRKADLLPPPPAMEELPPLPSGPTRGQIIITRANAFDLQAVRTLRKYSKLQPHFFRFMRRLCFFPLGS